MRFPIGAHACAGLLTLPEFEPEFARWGMVTDVDRRDTCRRHDPQPADDDRLLRLSLVAVWLFTAFASLVELERAEPPGAGPCGHRIAAVAGAVLIVGGAAADLAIGLALWWRPGRTSYRAALA
jgi:hypothetical protein